MKVLVIDIGGTNVKVATDATMEPVKIPSGPKMTPETMCSDVLAATKDWKYDHIAIGYPGPVRHHRPLNEPINLGKGWVGFDFEKALHKPLRFINDAAMQALGGYKGGKMLFLGLGTGLGSAMIVDGIVIPLELAHLPYKHGKTFEEYVGDAALKKHGKKKWREAVADVMQRLQNATECEHTLLGGGNARLLKDLPATITVGTNENAILGGLRLWDDSAVPKTPTGEVSKEKKRK